MNYDKQFEYKFLFYTLGKKNVINILVVLIFTIISSILSANCAWYLGKFIDNLYNEEWLNILVIIIVLEISSQILTKLSSYLNELLNHNVNLKVNNNILDKMSRISLELLEDPSTYNLFERVNDNIANSSLNTISDIFNLFSVLSNLIVYSIILYKIEWFFPMITIVFSIPYLLLLTKQGFDNYLLETSQNKDSRKLTYIYTMLTSRNFMKEIRLYNLKKELIHKSEHIRIKIWKEKYRLLLKYSLWTILISFLRNISICLCLFITCYKVINKESGIGDIVLVITAAKILTTDSSKLFSIVSGFKKSLLYFKDFKDFNLLEEEGSGNKKLIDNSIKFMDISFKYPNSQYYALDNINLEICPNELIAIVGENGSGKTTFLNLLLGLYQPESGKIYVGKKDLNEAIDTFRQQSSFLFQNFIRYQLSVKDNLKAGNYGNNINNVIIDDNVFLEFINNLPEGIDTLLGQLDHNGRELSGGEWQKIAIGRAIVKQNTKFLVMDEPTSALDPNIESKLYNQLKDLAKNKTVIISSHRLGITRICDKIYVFDKGKIIESGNHNKLMQIKGKYYDMFTAQKNLYV